MGAGAFSDVWAGRSLEAERAVALKLLRPPAQESARARIAREALAQRRIAHLRVCRLEAALPDASGLVLELLEGPSLAERLEEEPLAPALALPMFVDLFAALDAVHAAGVVHRDVSPANVLLDGRGGAKLIDFGIAKIDGDGGKTEPTLTSEDSALGTLVHQAPEQIDDPRTVDGRADVYGLGSTLFTVLAGRPAFRAPSAAALLVLKSQRDAPGLSEVTSRSWPGALEDFLRRALARERAARFGSGGEAAAALSRVRLVEER